jgi:hypothetical protein
MKEHRKNFRCDVCKNGRFEKIYTFSIDFRTVNFTDDIIYDIVDECFYMCKDCGELYTEEEIRDSLKNIIIKYKEDYWEERNK